MDPTREHANLRGLTPELGRRSPPTGVTPTPSLSNLTLTDASSREATPSPSGTGENAADTRKRHRSSDGADNEYAAKRGKSARPQLTSRGEQIYKELRNTSTKIIRLEAQVDFLQTHLGKHTIPIGYHVTATPAQLMINKESFTNRWKEILADCSYRLMTLTIEGINSQIQELEETKKGLIQQVKSLPAQEQHETTAALSAVCGRVRSTYDERFKKKGESNFKSLSRESFLEQRWKKHSKKRQGPKGKGKVEKGHKQDRTGRDTRDKRDAQDQRAPNRERQDKRAPNRERQSQDQRAPNRGRQEQRGHNRGRPDQRGPNQGRAGRDKTELLTPVLRMLIH